MTASSGYRAPSTPNTSYTIRHLNGTPRKQSETPRYSNSRLPWLDGRSLTSGSDVPSRKSSLPSVPGAFGIEQHEDENDVSRGHPPSEILAVSSAIKNASAGASRERLLVNNAESNSPTFPVLSKNEPPTQAFSESPQNETSSNLNPRRVDTEKISPRGTFHEYCEDRNTVVDAYRKSIAGMEKLLEEAIQIAQCAADSSLSTEVPIILHEATQALRQASQTNIPSRNLTMNSHSTSESSERSSVESTSTTDIPIYRSSSPGVEAGPDNAHHQKRRSSNSTCRTPPHFYRPSHDSIAVDWAYAEQDQNDSNHSSPSKTSLTELPTALRRRTTLPSKPNAVQSSNREHVNLVVRTLPTKEDVRNHIKLRGEPPILPRSSSLRVQRSPQYRDMLSQGNRPSIRDPTKIELPFDRRESVANRERGYGASPTHATGENTNWGRDKYDEKEYQTPAALKGRHHLSLHAHQGFSLSRHHRRQPIARNWTTFRKRIAALVACIDTALVGILIGIYAGEVPAIQYSLTDEDHYVILGNVVLYIGLAFTTFLFWPLPLLHGRKPYTLTALAIALPLQFPQAVVVLSQRSPYNAGYRAGLLVSRAFLGLALGFANMNFKMTLLDLFGASLQSENPHQEVVIIDDVRRHGGGMGLWLGIWTWCFIGSLAVGFLIGAGVISALNVAWGFYISVILIAATLILGVLSPETRRAPHRRTMQEVELPNETVSRRVARGEIRMHVQGDGPKYWSEEVTAGIYLSFKMLSQVGFAVLALYLGWIYAQIVLIIVLLGNLLSAEYRWRPQYVGLGVASVGIGALFAIPLSKANLFSRARSHGPRTDSMTFQPRVTRSSHLVRRVTFMTALPLCGLAYTLASRGPSVHFMVPIVFAAAIGFLSNLAITECHGLMMETYDTSDLQPGVNSKHRLQSMASSTRRRRTNYTSYPRVSAGIFISHTLGFFFAAAATGIGGRVTRHVGAQKATAIVASILMLLTILLTTVLWRFKEVQVIPNELFGRYFGSIGNMRESVATVDSARSWRAVIIGNPSGKMRRMSMLELGGLSRWTEIRRLNRLLNRSTTKALNEGWQ